MIAPRVYKPSLSYGQACQIITEGRGSHFDPDIVAAFVDGCDVMTAIANQYSDWGNPEG